MQETPREMKTQCWHHESDGSQYLISFLSYAIRSDKLCLEIPIS